MWGKTWQSPKGLQFDEGLMRHLVLEIDFAEIVTWSSADMIGLARYFRFLNKFIFGKGNA